MRLEYAAISDVGRVRKDNQDSGYAGPHVIAVCDGVGGAARGDIASSTAISQLRRLDDGPAPGEDERPARPGRRRPAPRPRPDRRAGRREPCPLRHQHHRDGRALRRHPARRWATSATAAPTCCASGELCQLTKDHTFVQTLIDDGQITEEESRVHPHRNLILKAIDGIHDLEPDLFQVDLELGDRLLFCSDGACGVLDADRLADILGSGNADFAAVELVRASLAAGSTDNVTCLVADVAEGELDLDVEPMLVGAAAELPRRGRGVSGLFRGHRAGDTGELEPVQAEIPDDVALRDPLRPDRPRGGALRARSRPRRFTWLRRVLALLVVVGLLWVAGAAAWSWTQQQYYVGEYDGKVAIYRGVNADLPGPRPVLAVRGHRPRDGPASASTTAARSRRASASGDLDAARSTVDNLVARAGRRIGGHLMSQTGAFLGFVHRRRRGAELFLLVLALGVGVGAYAAVGLGVEGTIPANMSGTPAGWPRW